MSYVLNKLVGVDSVILNIGSGDQVASKLEEFKNHFETYGTPIMIGSRCSAGGGVLAYTMLGVQLNKQSPEESQFLILDPHYKSTDDLKSVTDGKKGGVWWKGKKLFESKAFYNFCCPRPQ